MDEFLRHAIGVDFSTALGTVIIMIGVVCLSSDLKKPVLGGSLGAPLDVLLIIVGVWVITGG